MPDDEILQHGKTALLEILLKHIRARDFSQVIQLILQAVLVAYAYHISKDLFDSAVSYLVNAREREELEPLFNQIIIEVSEYKEVIMTYAEELKKEGEQRGIQLGKQEGRQEEKLEVATNLKKLGASEKMIAEATHLTLEQIRTLH